jgi:hypothetical protein
VTPEEKKKLLKNTIISTLNSSSKRKRLWFWCLTPLNNSSDISWWSVLFVEETGVPVKNHRPFVSHWDTLSHNVVLSTPRLIGIQTSNASCDRHKSTYHSIRTTAVHVNLRKVKTFKSRAYPSKIWLCISHWYCLYLHFVVVALHCNKHKGIQMYRNRTLFPTYGARASQKGHPLAIRDESNPQLARA